MYEDNPSLHPQADDMRDTLAIINVVRARAGVPLLTSLPTAVTGNAGECLYARAFADIAPVSVGAGAEMNFADTVQGRQTASLVARLTGGRMKSAHEVEAPAPFKRVISRFDSHQFPEFNDESY